MTPYPETETLKGEFRALLALEVTIEMLPLTLPVTAGVNATLKGVLAPADKVSGRVSPLIVNVEGVTVA